MEDHRVVEAGRDLWRSTLLLKTGVARPNFSRLCPDRLWISLRVGILLNPLIGAHLCNRLPLAAYKQKVYSLICTPAEYKSLLDWHYELSFTCILLCTISHIAGTAIIEYLVSSWADSCCSLTSIIAFKKSCFYEHSIKLFWLWLKRHMQAPDKFLNLTWILWMAGNTHAFEGVFY